MKTIHSIILSVIFLGLNCFAQQTSTAQTSTPTATELAQTVRDLYNDSLRFQEDAKLDAALSKAEQALALVPANDVSQTRPALLPHIGTIHDDAKRYEQATPFHQQALELEEKRIGVDNPKLDAYLFWLAGNHINRANFNEAEKVYLRLVQITQNKKGFKQYDLQEPLTALANLYDLQGRLDDTERVVNTLIEIASKPQVIFGVTFDTFASASQSLGAMMLRRGNIKEAIRLHLNAQARLDEQMEKNLKSSNEVGTGLLTRSIKCLERLARLYELDKDESQAKQFAAKAQTLRSRLPVELFNLRRPPSWGQSILSLEAKAHISR